MAKGNYEIDHQSVATIAAIMQNLAGQINTNFILEESGETSGDSWEAVKQIAQKVNETNAALQTLITKTVEFLQSRNVSIREKDREEAANYMRYWWP